MAKIELVYHVDVLSSWCLIAEDALARVRQTHGDAIACDWRIAPLREAFDYTPEQLRFYYQRTHRVTGVMLNPAWLESTSDGSRWANLAAEAARGLGCADDRVRIALARAAMIDGRRACDRAVAIDVASAASGLSSAAIERAMADPATAARIEASRAEFARLGVNVRPTFVVRNAVGDISVLSGCWRFEPLSAAVQAHIDDQRAYESFMAENRAPAGVV